MTAAPSDQCSRQVSLSLTACAFGRRALLAGRTQGRRAVRLSAVALLTMVVFWPTLQNGFLSLGFDDGLILDTPAIRAISWANIRALATEFNHAHFVPLTMLSFAVDYRLWGLDPVAYHRTNILTHAATAVLFCIFLWPLVPSPRVAVLAAMIFAVHPVQMEAVSLAVQRKTLLSGALYFATLILYQRWCRTQRWRAYALCVAAFIAAALAKPAVVTLPLLLMLYDMVFGSGRARVAEKLPFFAVAIGATVMAMRAHAAVGALNPPHGGNMFANMLLMSRVFLEYIDALFLPVNLSPIYYYPREAVYAPVNFCALAAIVALSLLVTCHRPHRWSFFCFWWFLLALLPESNLVPLAQLRADRFLYLAVAAFAVWVALGVERIRAELPERWGSFGARLLGPAIVGTLAVGCSASAGVWRDDVTAWRRVVERHPWAPVAYTMLGRADYERQDYVSAEQALQQALRLKPDPDAHRYLAKVYAASGRADLAEVHLRHLLQLAPADEEALDLLTPLCRVNGD